ncbi:MAG: GC-type dockerin domain-anchored protein [Phycisphaerales bacterium]
MSVRRTALASVCSLLAFGSAAFGQTATLKNDRFANDVSSVQDAQMSIQAGFDPGEMALAILTVPTALQGAFKVTHVQIMWASTAPGTVPPSDQASVMIYSGSVLQPNAFLVFDSANDAAAGDGLTPQMQDGGLNDFDFSTENIVLHNVAKISVGLQFSTATNQTTGPSVCSDWPPNNASHSTAGANAIYGTWPEMGITTAQFFEPRVNLGGGVVFGISGNFFIRAIIESASSCPADLGHAGGFAGPDGQLDNNDFIMFINYFFTNNPIADIGRCGR